MKEIHHCKGLYAWCECKCAGGTRDSQRSIEGLCPHCVENIFVDAVRAQARPWRERTTKRRKTTKARKARARA